MAYVGVFKQGPKNEDCSVLGPCWGRPILGNYRISFSV